ncbi:hypothetical protein AB0N28_03510 [Streptomyces sp. NPDC051130]|uniref:hypothetical protein n=1 Tax=Streptomyces sp. NPDC051130 TaxID=3157223 RepID=UPI00341EDABB
MTSGHLCTAGLIATWLTIALGLIGAHGVGSPVLPAVVVLLLLTSWVCFVASWRKLASEKHGK